MIVKPLSVKNEAYIYLYAHKNKKMPLGSNHRKHLRTGRNGSGFWASLPESHPINVTIVVCCSVQIVWQDFFSTSVWLNPLH